MTGFNKVREQYYLSELEVMGVKLGIKSQQVESGKVPILKEFNDILEKNDLEDLYASSFTLTNKMVLAHERDRSSDPVIIFDVTDTCTFHRDRVG